MKKLISIQAELKAPKNQFNGFGKYKYRSTEDILEAVKPLLSKNNVSLVITDDIIMLSDRFYVKATASLYNDDGSLIMSNTALARESENKKGMDESQITGATSSYARKYALNGLFLIDDTKDSDFTNTHDQESKLTEAMKQEIDAFTDVNLLRAYYASNEGKGKEWADYVVKKGKELDQLTK